MDRAEALLQLPQAYGLILRLTDLGADSALISACLQVEVEAVGPMLEVAQRKLETVLAAERSTAELAVRSAVQVSPTDDIEIAGRQSGTQSPAGNRGGTVTA